MAKQRLFSLANKAQLWLTALLALLLCAVIYFHWYEQNTQRIQTQTERKLVLAQQLNANLNNHFSRRATLFNQWLNSLPLSRNFNLAERLNNDWPLLQTAGSLTGIQLYPANGSPIVQHGSDWAVEIDSNWANAVYRIGSPQQRIACAQSCALYIAVPVHRPQLSNFTLIAQLPIAALITNLLNGTETSAFIIHADQGEGWQQSWLGLAHSKLPDFSSAEQLKQSLAQAKLPLGLARYHYKLLPLGNSRQLNWLLLNDEADYFARRYALLKIQALVGLLGVIAVLCMSWLFSRHQLLRLHKHINTLRLIASQQYEEARHRFMQKPSSAPDELDMLNDVASELTFQLEASARSADSRNREMERLALYDPLTNLANRNLFIYEIEQLVQTGVDLRQAALLVIDIDKFQRINDSLGHTCGDQLLSKVAERIRTAVGLKDFCARLSGNVFGVLITNLNDADLKIRVNKIAEFIRQPLVINQQKLMITASIGIAQLEPNANANELLQNAETAMYRAKQQGGNRHFIFSPELKSLSRIKVSLEAEIHRALEQKEFCLYLQSKVDMSNTIRGFEALCRWDHPDRGILAPAEFVPIMADLDLQTPLDKWMLEASCRQLKTWQNLYPDINISVNIASDHFSTPGFISFLQQTINRYGIKPGQLEIEITETLLMDNINLAKVIIEKVKALGVSVAIDDFGTGYSSLSYLKNLPVDTLKIDREFIKDIPFDESDMHISAVIIFLAKQLGFKVVAEGVETIEQLEFLQANNCDLAQGYYFSKPIPAHKTMIVLESQRTMTPASSNFS